MGRNIFISICFLIFGVAAAAQPSLTLEEYRRQVIDYSNQLKISTENSNAALERFKMIRAGYLPALGVAANGSYQVGNEVTFGSMQMKDYNYTSTVTLQQRVYAGGSVRAGTKAADIEHSIAQINDALTLQNVMYAADVTYWAFAASVEQMNVARQYEDIVRSLYDVINIRFKDGYVSRTDLLMVETRLNEAELNVISARQYYLNSLTQLSTLLGQSQVGEYIPMSPISEITPLDKIITIKDSYDQHPEYKLSEMKVNLQNQNIKLVRSRYNPQFNVGVQAVYGTPILNFTGDSKFYGVAFAQLSIPLFMWGERRHSVAATRAAVRSSEYAMRDTQDKVSGELKSAIINLEQTMKQTQVAEKNLSTAKDNLDLNTFSYNEGRLPIIDVLQSQLAWIQAYTSFVNTNYSYQTAVAGYYKAAGVSLR